MELNDPKAKRIQELDREIQRLTKALDVALGNRLPIDLPFLPVVVVAAIVLISLGFVLYPR